MRALPEPVRRSMGFALRFVQGGVKPYNAKPLRGFGGAGVLEIVYDHDGGTFRAVYTVDLPGIVYVLHCFQKKASHGAATPKRTVDLIRRRFAAAQSVHGQRIKEA